MRYRRDAVARSPDHRWMVIAYIVAGLYFLVLLPLRMYGAHNESRRDHTPHVTQSNVAHVVDLQMKVTQPAELSEFECVTSLQHTAFEVDLYSNVLTGVDHHDDYIGQIQQYRNGTVVQKHQRQESHWSKDEVSPVPLDRWLKHRPDLAGLPISMGDSCRLTAVATQNLRHVSQQFGRLRSQPSLGCFCAPELGSTEAAFDRRVEADRSKFLAQLRNSFRDSSAIPGLVQIMQGCGVSARLAIVEWLADLRTSTASAALAGRAVFDPAPDVRSASIAALLDRDPSEFRSVLMTGLRYVWAPAAQHAAVVLVAVNDQDARTELLNLAYAPNPQLPHRDLDGNWFVHQLTRVNHLRNCLLCHAPSVDGIGFRAAENRLDAAVPIPGRRIIVYSGRNSSAESVRADITYLRQDFSVRHEMEEPAPWPEHQRFDYFVRTNRISEVDARYLQRRYRSHDYPQRRSVLFALQQLEAQHWTNVIASSD
jgi:hypothetical protein